MLKKLILIVLCSANLCVAESSVKPSESIDIALAAYFLGVMVPKDLESPEVKAKYKESTIQRFKIANTAAQIALGLYCFAKLAKGFYDYCYPSQTQEAIAKSAAQFSRLLQAQLSNLEKCRAKKAAEPTNPSNNSTDCQELANAFIAALRQPAF